MGSNLKAAVSITVSSLLKKAVFRILLKAFYNGFILILCNIYFRYGQTCTKKLLHEGSNMHKGTHLQEETFLYVETFARMVAFVQ